MKSKLTVFVLGILLSTNVLAQDKNPMYYGFDFTGRVYFDNSQNLNLRSDFVANQGSSTIAISAERFQFGAKFAVLSKNEKVGFETGLRYAIHHKIISGDKDTPYFLLVDDSHANPIDYYQVTKITQNTGYLGIPLELIVTPNKKDKFARFYFKFGVEFDFMIRNNSHIKPIDSQCKDAVNQLAKNLPSPYRTFEMYFYTGFGVLFGRPGEQQFCLQLLFPYLSYRAFKRPLSGGSNLVNYGILSTNECVYYLTKNIFALTFEYKLPIKR